MGEDSYVKAKWNYSNKCYIVSEKVPKEKTRENIEYLTPEDLIKGIIEHDRKLLVSIRDGKIIKDRLKLISATKKNILKGEIVGTKEVIIKKLMTIKEHMSNLHEIKYRILDNIYMSVIEASQAALVMSESSSLIPRNIPQSLKKEFRRNKIHIDYIAEIIKVFKDYEHRKIPMPSGRKIDDLSVKAEAILNEIKIVI